MTYPINYTPSTDFSQDESNNVSGRSTVRTANLDTEFANIKTSFNLLNSNVKLIQRDDGALKDAVVTKASLSPAVVLALGNNPDTAQALLDAIAATTAQAEISTTQAGISTAQAGISTAQAVISTTQAEISTAQAVISTTQATLSTTAKVAAEAARDSINTTGKVFTTTALGIAGTTDGQSFAVLSTDLLSWQIYKNNAGVALYLAGSYTTAYLDSVVNRNAEQFVYGGQVMSALTDKDGRAFVVWLLDGILRGKLGLVASSTTPLTYTFSTTTGLTTVDIPVMSQSTSSLFVNNREVIGGLSDVAGAMYLAMQKDGVTYVPKLEYGALVNTITLSYLAQTTAQLFVNNQEIIGGLTDVNGATYLAMQKDGTTYIPKLQVGSLTGGSSNPALYYQAVAGGASYPIVANKLIVPFGNSISTTAQGYVTALAALRPTDGMSIQGISGQRTDDIAYRVGALPLTLSVTGASIPASGAVAVTGLNTTLFRRTSGTASVKATIAGIAGVLSVAAGVYNFTRTTAGSVTAVTNPVSVYVNSGFVDGSVDPSAQPTLDTLFSGTTIMVLTYNDIKETTYNEATTVLNVGKIIAKIKSLSKRLIVVGDCIGQGRLTVAQFPANPSPPADAATSQLWITRSLSLNAALQAKYPLEYLDMQGTLITAGYSSVFNVNGTNYDVINLTVFPDGIHPTSGGATIYATVVNNFFTQLGF